MNLQEFAALKVGDTISNPMSNSAGTVSKVTAFGVDVVWGARHDKETPFFYSTVSTAWMSWAKDDDSKAGAA
jgi:hypothetical protein